MLQNMKFKLCVFQKRLGTSYVKWIAPPPVLFPFYTVIYLNTTTYNYKYTYSAIPLYK